ncbi:hypothetical protein O0544_09390 [Edwardsiella anguillarum]|nr:hypothetical protein [Edwardsiella anguillarum]
MAALPPGVSDGVAPLRCGSDSGRRGGLAYALYVISSLRCPPIPRRLASRWGWP